MSEAPGSPVDDVRRLAFIREETRFEMGVLHDRINALISAEAFLTIAFTMAMGNANSRPDSVFFVLISLTLALVGLILAALAWPGVNTSFKVIIEWNAILRQVLHENAALTASMWRPPLLNSGDLRADLDQRSSMLFARLVPALFGVAWTMLAITALVLPSR